MSGTDRNSNSGTSARDGRLRRRRRNVSDLALIIVAMMTGGMLSYVLTSFATVPKAQGLGAMTALLAVIGIGLCIVGCCSCSENPINFLPRRRRSTTLEPGRAFFRERGQALATVE